MNYFRGRASEIWRCLIKYIALLLFTVLLLSGCFGTYKSEKKDMVEAERVADSLAFLDSIARTPLELTQELNAGEGLFQVLERFNINRKQALDIINKLRFNVELTGMKVGEKFTAKFTRDTATLLEFDFKEDIVKTHRIIVDTVTGSLSYICEKKKTETKYRELVGTLEENSTLNQSLIDAGFSSSLTQVVNGILLCKISFRTDAREGDSFRVVLQEEYYKDTIIPSRTKVLYTSYNGVRTGFHEAYRFDDGEKSTYTAHYTPEGEALINSGIRYPLDRLHIASGYGMRIHPVTGKKSFHRGVDLSSQVGSNVYSVAPGRVVVSNYDRLSGNKIAIRHPDGYISYYLHLSRKLVTVGQFVRSHQIIGKVGATGRVTGPHLHFGMKKPNGRWMNPLQKRMIATPKLAGDRLAMFEVQKTRIDSIRENLGKAGSVIVLNGQSDRNGNGNEKNNG